MSDFEITRNNGVKFESTCLSLTRQMDIEEAGKFVLGLDTMESCSAWWIGSFLNQMESLHGEKYAQLVPEGKAHTWAVYKWVDSRVKHNIRRDPKVLSFSHHMAVASLLTERQEIYLARAEQEQLSVSALKKLVASDKGRKEKPPKTIECPACHTVFEVPHA